MDPIVTLDHGITRIDGDYVRPGLAAFYLVVEHGRAAFIDTCTSHSVPRALAALRAAGLAPEQVDWILPTHVHLDHGGGTGALLRELPNARVVLHPRGAPHLRDPAKLVAGSTAIYGAAKMQEMFGEIVAVPDARLVESHDGMQVDLAGRQLTLLHTPGHALHHYCVWDPASRGLFTGDTFGISYREFDTANGAYLFATTTPVQLDPDAWLATVDRLLELDPSHVYLTHFGRLGDVRRLAMTLKHDLRRVREQALKHAGDPDPQAAIRRRLEVNYLGDLEAHGVSLARAQILELLRMDLDLNSAGLATWLRRRQA